MRMNIRIQMLIIAIMWMSGCAYRYQDHSEIRKPEGDEVLVSSELKGEVQRALGNAESARRYYGLYEALAMCVGDPKYPWKMTREIEEDVVRAREILELKHGEFPEFTKVVTEHLSPLKENRELTEEVRKEWSRKLRELAGACKGVAQKGRNG